MTDLIITGDLTFNQGTTVCSYCEEENPDDKHMWICPTHLTRKVLRHAFLEGWRQGHMSAFQQPPTRKDENWYLQKIICEQMENE